MKVLFSNKCLCQKNKIQTNSDDFDLSQCEALAISGCKDQLSIIKYQLKTITYKFLHNIY